VLQDRKWRPIGGTTSYKTQLPFDRATNRRPEEAIKDGKLREICFTASRHLGAFLAPLRERREKTSCRWPTPS